MKKVFSIVLLFVVFGIVKTQASIVLYMANAKPGDNVGYTSFNCMPNGENTAWLVCAGQGNLHCLTVDQAEEQCPGAVLYFDPGDVTFNVQNIIGNFYAAVPITTGSYNVTYYDAVGQSQVVTFSWSPDTVHPGGGIRLQIDAI